VVEVEDEVVEDAPDVVVVVELNRRTNSLEKNSTVVLSKLVKRISFRVPTGLCR